MLYYEDIKLRRRRGMYRRETSYIYVYMLGAKPLDEPLTNTGDTLQRYHTRAYTICLITVPYRLLYTIAIRYIGGRGYAGGSKCRASNDQLECT